MDREELKKLAVEETLRALERRGAGGAAEPPPPGEPAGVEALAVFTGSASVAPGLLDPLENLAKETGRLWALASFSFRQAGRHSEISNLAGIHLVENPDDERAMGALAGRAAWVVAPDVSPNTLRKAALGIEDSAPTRAIAEALRRGKTCFFLESESVASTPAGLERLELIRRLERLGARIACPKSIRDLARQALAPPEARLYQPPPPRPIQRRRIVTAEDVYEGSRRGLTELAVPPDAIVTGQAHEEAARRGLAIRREGES